MTGPPGEGRTPSTLAALVALFGVNVSMILFGLLQEKYEKPGGGTLPFWLGCIAAVTPWIAIGIYLVSPGSAASPPASSTGPSSRCSASSTASPSTSGRSIAKSGSGGTTSTASRWPA